MARKRILVLGGGLAGLATAWHLAARADLEVTLLERDAGTARRASRVNAGILRTAVDDAALHALARAAADFYHAPPAGFAPAPLLRAVGVVLAAEAGPAAELAAWARDPARGGDLREEDPARLRADWPALAPGLTRCWRAEQDGVLDAAAVGAAFHAGASARGARILTTARALELLRAEDGAVRGVRAVPAGAAVPEELEASAVVLAGGAWATEPAAAARLDLPLRAVRRHLLQTAPHAAVPADAPVVWILGARECYFRPEAGGLLASACDELEVDPAEGERGSPAEAQRIQAAIARWLPACADAAPLRLRAAMRTFAPDHRFVIGPDPRAAGLYWCAALGGHGLTCAPEVGRLAAAWAAGEDPEAARAAPFLPARLLTVNAPAATAPAAASLRG